MTLLKDRTEGGNILTWSLSQSLVLAGLHTLLREIGRLVALLHDGGLIHGDLTTSNMLIRSSNNQLVSVAYVCDASILHCWIDVCACKPIYIHKSDHACCWLHFLMGDSFPMCRS